MLLENHLSVSAAAMITNYNAQYLRRLLRADKLEGIKIGQVWLIKLGSLREYLQQAEKISDQRYGPK